MHITSGTSIAIAGVKHAVEHNTNRFSGTTTNESDSRVFVLLLVRVGNLSNMVWLLHSM